MITTRQVSLDFNRLAMPTKQSVAKSTPRGVVTVMFTDIVDSSRHKSAMTGDSTAARDANYHAQIKGPHDQLVLRCVADHLAAGWSCSAARKGGGELYVIPPRD